jgi:hypothetical protein
VQAGQRYQETGWLDAAALSQPQEAAGEGAALYRCRKCRGLVATAHNIVETEQASEGSTGIVGALGCGWVLRACMVCHATARLAQRADRAPC